LIPKQYAARLIFDTLHERAAKFTPIMGVMDDRARGLVCSPAQGCGLLRFAPASTASFFDPTQQKTEFIQQILIIAKRATHWLGVAKNRLRESGSRQDV
jgi:hypothetical protein